jgi:hypothetical protein
MKETTKNITLEKVLNDAEKIEIGKFLVKLVQDLELEQSAKAMANKSFNDQIKWLQKEITKTAQELNTGIKNVEVTARLEIDQTTGDKRYYDLVTGELLKTELNEELNPNQLRISDVLQEQSIDDYGMTDLDYRKLLRDKFFIPLNIDVQPEFADGKITYGINNIIVEGYENDILEWLKYINREENYYKLEFENTTIGLATYKVQYLSITDYDIRDYLERKATPPTIENIFEEQTEETEEALY